MAYRPAPVARTRRSIPQRVISGTSLAAVIATGAAAGSVYWGASQVDLVSAAVVASSALLTAPMGARATHAFNCNTLRGFMAYWLFLAAAAVPLKAYLFSGRAAQAPDAAAGANTTSSGGGGGGGDRSRQEAGAPSSQADGGAPEAGGGAAISSSLRSLCSADLVLAATGAVAGFASGLLGIGGGTIVTPLLAICTDLTQTEILGTSLAAMVLPSALGLAQHFKLGNVDIRMAGMLAAGTFAGGYCGSQFALQLPTAALQLVFSAGMTFLGVKTLKAAAKAAATAAAAAAAKQGAGKAVTAAAPAAAAVAAAKSA